MRHRKAVLKDTKMEIHLPITDTDRAWLKELWVSEWGGETMVSKGVTYHFDHMSSVIARVKEQRVGAATFALTNSDCELISINAVKEGLGVGSALLTSVEDIARQAGMKRVWLITSNDNVDALRFYQKRGYRMVAVYPNAIDDARLLKPTIPLVGEYGIPIHDEIELKKVLE